MWKTHRRHTRTALTSPSLQKVLHGQVQYIVLNKEDRMLNMAPSKGPKRTIMFSTTFPNEIQKLTKNKATVKETGPASSHK